MKNCIQNNDLILAIVNYGKASKLMKTAKMHGVSGGTIFIGRGTANDAILKKLGITDVRKEIIIMATEEDKTKEVLEALDHKYEFSKPNHGIAVSTKLDNLCGHPGSIYNKSKEIRENKNMFLAIFVIVDKGNADDVIDAATLAGARGATVVNARGSGIHEQQMLFSFPIEPEKEIVLIISDAEKSHEIVEKIRTDFEIDKPGKGILFTIYLNDAYGLY